MVQPRPTRYHRAMSKKGLRRLAVAVLIASLGALALVRAQQQAVAQRRRKDSAAWDVENELQSIAVVERKVMMPMRDGVRLATDIYRPKNAAGESADRLGAHAVQLQLLGRAQRRAGRHDARRSTRSSAATPTSCRTSAGTSSPKATTTSSARRDRRLRRRSTGLTKQPWSNGKVGTTGCSSTAEWQMGVAALGHPGFAAMNVQGFGAGVGRVGPYYEQGNWYRGGAVQMLFIAWLYGEQNQVRPMFPPNTSQEDLIRASKSFDLAQHLPPVDWAKALWHLPVQDIIEGRRRPARHLRRRDAGRDRRHDDPARRRTIRRGTRAACITTT